MPSKSEVDAFIKQVMSNDHVGAIRDWYADDAFMQENQGEPRRGRETLIAQEGAMLAACKEVVTELLDPPMIEGDRVAIRWRFTFRFKAGGGFSQEEIAWQRWRDGKIVEEIFFYDPAQRTR